MPGPRKQSRFMQRCVADVSGQGKDLGAAFAICTAQSQKSGYSQPGARTQTPRGAAREKHFKGQDDMGAKAGAFERAVQRGRKGKEESMDQLLRRLEEGTLERFLTLPRGWGAADGLRFKKDQEAWKQKQFALIRKAQAAATRELRDLEDDEEANATQIAENVAHDLGHDEWLDDDTHWIWDVAMDAATKWNKAHGWEE
ncbi:MAG: hypothetical protein WC683_01500 [bacterium]